MHKSESIPKANIYLVILFQRLLEQFVREETLTKFNPCPALSTTTASNLLVFGKKDRDNSR